MPCVLRSIPVAVLNHLQMGESILPLPQPASLSDAEITLRDLVEQHGTWTAYSTYGRKQGRTSENGWS